VGRTASQSSSRPLIPTPLRVFLLSSYGGKPRTSWISWMASWRSRPWSLLSWIS
jgi:hypothetical protein